jgi:hypothetical protein
MEEKNNNLEIDGVVQTQTERRRAGEGFFFLEALLGGSSADYSLVAVTKPTTMYVS